MIDNTCGFERMSFMNEFSRYNQIKMYLDDEKHTFFRTPLGLYCYTVMPFGLKNAGATYQRAMNVILHEHIHKTVKRYVDDITVKSRAKGDHMGFVVTSKRIHLDPEKVHDIKEMQPPRNLRELRGLQTTSIYPKVYLKSLRTMPTFH